MKNVATEFKEKKMYYSIHGVETAAKPQGSKKKINKVGFSI